MNARLESLYGMAMRALASAEGHQPLLPDNKDKDRSARQFTLCAELSCATKVYRSRPSGVCRQHLHGPHCGCSRCARRLANA